MRTVALSLLPIYLAVTRTTRLPVFMQVGVDSVWTIVEIVCVLFIQKMNPTHLWRSLSLYMFLGSLGSSLGAMWGGCFLDAGFSYSQSMAYSSILRFVVGLSLLLYLRSKSPDRIRGNSFKESLMNLLSSRSAFPRSGGVLPFEPRVPRESSPLLTRRRFRPKSSTWMNHTGFGSDVFSSRSSRRSRRK